MKREENMSWERLEKVIRATGYNVNSFAKHIGLRRSENLYQIKKGNNGVSLDLAKRIHAQFPQYSVGWLVCGENAPSRLIPDESKIVRFPLYPNYTTVDFPLEQEPDDYLIISASLANGADFAVKYSDDILNPYLRGAYLLMKKHHAGDPILFGNIYMVKLQGLQLIRIVKKYELNPERVSLATLQPSTLGDIDITLDAITDMWHVVGAVCNLVR